jgi:hypothetical protein
LLSQIKVIDVMQKFDEILGVADAVDFLLGLLEEMRLMLAHHVKGV